MYGLQQSQHSMKFSCWKGYGPLYNYLYIYFFNEPTGNTGQSGCRVYRATGMTINSWGTGSSGVSESCPHVICHYTSTNKAYYHLKQTQPYVKWQSRADWRRAICYERITDTITGAGGSTYYWCTSPWEANLKKKTTLNPVHIIGLLRRF